MPATAQQNPFATLRRLAKRSDAEQCEFCSLPLSSAHRHLFEVAARKIVCTCDACALRFENVVGRWKLIPRDALLLSNFKMADEDWASLSLPINLAFFFRSTPANKIIAMYPSPAGATESLLPLENWESLHAASPRLARMEADVQALLVNRLNERRDYFLAPIDACFELVGLIRLHWRGLSGGEKIWREIETFFDRLKAAAIVERSSSVERELMEAGHA